MRQVVAVLQSTEHHTFPVTDDLATAMRAKADFQLEVCTTFSSLPLLPWTTEHT